MASVLASANQERFGLSPYEPGKNKAQDVGLGGPSTEFLATDYDKNGKVFNYPMIWWDKAGKPILLGPDEAYSQALAYENATPYAFPRFKNIPTAEFFAESRSSMGGGDVGRLGTKFGRK